MDKFVCINDYYDDIDCAFATFCIDKEYFGKIQPDGNLSVDSNDIEDVDEGLVVHIYSLMAYGKLFL